MTLHLQGGAVRSATTLAMLLALAACHHANKSNDQRTASGEVLAGTISDSMIPYDSLTSRPPLAPHSDSRSGGAANADAAEADSAGDPSTAAPDESAPAPPPAAAASPGAPIHY